MSILNKILKYTLSTTIFSVISFSAATSKGVELHGLKVPEKTLPVPDTVSPELRKTIGKPLNKSWNNKPTSADAWKASADQQARDAAKAVPQLLAKYNVSVEKSQIDGVNVFFLSPKKLNPANRNRVLLHMHGGCYVYNAGEAGLPEAIYMAGIGGYNVISVDYRMPPTAYFPEALNDGMRVWQSLLKRKNPETVGFFGTSAGGALVLQMALKSKQDKLRLPGAIASGTPMSDLTKRGDSFYTNEMVDNILVSRSGFCDAAAKFYANGHDLQDPLLSPVYGDMRGFPPTILTTGTRDLLLSNTVRVHRKLRQAKVDAILQVYEGQSHAHYIMNDAAPETKEVFQELADFFDKNLSK